MKSFVLIAVAASLGMMPAFISPNPGQTARHVAKNASKPSAESEAKAAEAAKAEMLGKAKKLYEMDCALCHGDTGNGKTDVAKEMSLVIPDWTDPKTLTGKSDADLFSIIRNGKDKMPAEGAGRAKDDEVNGLVAYIRTLAAAGPAAPPAQTPEPAPAEPKN